jgi:hypothetical protein
MIARFQRLPPLRFRSFEGRKGQQRRYPFPDFQGFAKSFKGIESAGAKDLANAFSNAVDAAYKAVMNPTEGTILTVIRKASEAANDMAETMDDPLEVGFAALMAAREALAKTPEQLPVLKKQELLTQAPGPYPDFRRLFKRF